MRLLTGFQKEQPIYYVVFQTYPFVAHSDALRVLVYATNSSRFQLRKGSVTLATDDKERLMQPGPIVRVALDTTRRRHTEDTTKEDRVHAIISMFDL